jgi:hypothetical protein
VSVAKVSGPHDRTIDHIHRNHFGLRDKTIGTILPKSPIIPTYTHTYIHTAYATLISSLNEVKEKFGMPSKTAPKIPT